MFSFLYLMGCDMKGELLFGVTVCILTVLGGCPAVDQTANETDLRTTDGVSGSQHAATTPPANAASDDSTDETVTMTGAPGSGNGVTGYSGTVINYGTGGPTTTSASGSGRTGTGGSTTSTESAEPNDASGDPNLALPAVDFVALRFVTAAAVFSAYGDLGDARLNLEPNTMFEWGVCPRVSIASGDAESLISFDFGTGCAASCAGGDTVIGSNGEIYWRHDYPAAVYVVDGFTVDGRVVIPYLLHPQINPSLPDIMNANMTFHATGVTLTGPCDFGVSAVGRTSGNLTLQIERQYVLTFTIANWTFDGNSQVGSATFAGMVVRPAVYGNLRPDAGIATFTATLGDGSHTVEVEFGAQTPVDGTVYVSVDGGASFTYHLQPAIR